MGTEAASNLSPLQVKRALNRNIVAGCFGMLFAACTSLQFATQFALELGANNFQIGLLTTLPLLGYPLQLLSAYLVERLRRRKPFWFFTALVHRSLWVAILTIPFFLGHEYSSLRVFLFLLLVFLSSALSIMSVAPWFSWMADLVPPDKAGKFWGRRSAILNAFMLSSLLLGRFVDHFTHGTEIGSDDPMRFLPFAILFGVGFVLGELDLLIHRKIPEPPMRESPQKLDLIGMIKEPILNPGFRRFLVWNCTWSFSVTMLNAFVTVYFLEALHRSQFFISVLVSVALMSRVLMARYWGVLADRFGHTSVNTICDFCLLAIPLGYLFVNGQNCIWLLIVIHIWAGVFGAGLDTASTAMMLSLPRSENKSMSIAVLYSLVGILCASAPLLGGWILQHYEGRTAQFMLWEFDNFKMLFLAVLFLRIVFFPFSLRLDNLATSPTGIVVRRLMDANPFRVIRHVHVLTESSAEADRVRSVQELASARSAIATRELIAALEDPSREVRFEAALALGRIGDTEAVEPLLRCFSAPDSGIQATASFALGKLRDPRAVPALIEALLRPHLAQSAAFALGEIGDRAAVEPLLTAFRHADTTEPARATIGYALSRLNETSALPDLLVAMHGTQSPFVRQELATAVGNLLGPRDDFYRLFTLERQVDGQEVSRLHDQIARAKVRFKTNPNLIQQVMSQLDDAQSAYHKGQWQDSMLAYTRAGLLLSGSVAVAPTGEGILGKFADPFRSQRRKAEAALRRRDDTNGPLWFLLTIAYPQGGPVPRQVTREEALLAFYAFLQIWESKLG